MKVQNIQLANYQTNFKANTQIKQNVPNPVLKESFKTAGIWLGFGLGFDYFCRKCVVFKNSPIGNSLFINSTLALIAGGYTLLKGMHDQKVHNNH